MKKKNNEKILSSSCQKKTMIFYGLAFIMIGTLLFVHGTFITLQIPQILMLFAYFLIVLGVFSISGYFAVKLNEGVLFKAILELVLGTLIITHPQLGVKTALILIVTWMLALGFFKVIISIGSLQNHANRGKFFAGLIAIGSSFFLLFYPFHIVETLAFFAVFYGVFILTTTLDSKKIM